MWSEALILSWACSREFGVGWLLLLFCFFQQSRADFKNQPTRSDPVACGWGTGSSRRESALQAGFKATAAERQ